MHFKLIVALVADDKTDAVIERARAEGATGSTVLNSARGEGMDSNTSFFGLSLESSRDMVLLLVEEHSARAVLESIADEAAFESEPGSGIAFQMDVEDAVGVSRQVEKLVDKLEAEDSL